MRALRNIILIKLDPKEEVTKGGVVLPSLAQERAVMGEVISVGPGRVAKDGSRVPIELEVGQRVLIRKYCGDIIDVRNNIMAIYDHDIEGIIV